MIEYTTTINSSQPETPWTAANSRTPLPKGGRSLARDIDLVE